MSDMMTFPDTVDEFMEQYKLVDTKQVYTNGTELVPIFRMKQWFEHLQAIEPERKTGEWLTSDDMYETGICSCCRYDTQEPVSYVITNFEYCPNCGAKMEETK